MALIVGNLLTTPAATSFISLADAVAYLEAEAAGAGVGTPMGDWLVSGFDVQEATLARASRWMAISLPWCRNDMQAADLVAIGHVAARLAVQALNVDLWAAPEVGKDAKRYKAGSVEVEYHSATAARGAQAGGRRFPWAYPMLKGLLCGTGGQHDVVRR